MTKVLEEFKMELVMDVVSEVIIRLTVVVVVLDKKADMEVIQMID